MLPLPRSQNIPWATTYSNAADYIFLGPVATQVYPLCVEKSTLYDGFFKDKKDTLYDGVRTQKTPYTTENDWVKPPYLAAQSQ